MSYNNNNKKKNIVKKNENGSRKLSQLIGRKTMKVMHHENLRNGGERWEEGSDGHMV